MLGSFSLISEVQGKVIKVREQLHLHRRFRAKLEKLGSNFAHILGLGQSWKSLTAILLISEV